MPYIYDPLLGYATWVPQSKVEETKAKLAKAQQQRPPPPKQTTAVDVKPKEEPKTHEELTEAGYYPILSYVGERGPEYVYVPSPKPREYLTPKPTFQEQLFRKYPHLAFGAVSIPGVGVPPKEYPIVKRIKHVRQALSIPVVQQVMVAGVGAQEWLTGPSVTSAAVTTGVEFVLGKGFSTKHFEELPQYPIEYHVGTLGMDIFFAYALSKPTGVVTRKAWKGAKYVARKTKTAFVEWAFPQKAYEKALYQKVVAAKTLVPEEEVFRVLTKTKRGWEYQPLRITETLTEETGKKTAWKPLTITKPKGFKPKLYKWTPPQPLKKGLKPLPKEFLSSTKKGMVLVTKQITKQTPKTTLKVAAPKLVLPEVAVSFLAVKTVPSLVKYKGKPFPSIYKRKKDIITITAPKVASYPKEKKTGKRKTKEKESPELVRIPKKTELLKESQLSKATQLTKQVEVQSQMMKQRQKQIQKQDYMRKFRLKLKEPKRKKREQVLFGHWRKRTHPILTPEAYMKRMQNFMRKGR